MATTRFNQGSIRWIRHIRVSTFKLPYCGRFQQHPWYATNGRLWYNT